MDQQPQAPQQPQNPQKTPSHHLLPVIAVIFAMAVATAIFAWILWPRDEGIESSSVKMNLTGNSNATVNANANTFVTNTNANANANANSNTNQ